MDSEKKSQSSSISNESDEEKETCHVLELPTISENIFKYLPASELSTCAKTCRSWNIVASSAKKKRRQIYVMSWQLNENQEIRFPCFVRKIGLKLWSQPNLAIAFAPFQEYENMAIAIQLFYEEHLEGSEALLSHGKKIYYRSIQEAERRNKLFRNQLPRNCSFMNINLPVHDNSSQQDSHPLFPPCLSSRLVLIPSIPGLEIQPFAIPPPGNTSFLDRSKIELLHVSSEKNVLCNNIKCILLFAHATERDTKKIVFAESSIAKYITEETVVIGGRSSSCPISTGIAISGKKVSIECFYIEDSLCYLQQCFLVLKEIGAHNEDGVAFLLKEDYKQGSILHSLWKEYFPKIVLMPIYLDSGLITTALPSNVPSFNRCDGCGKQSNIRDPVDKKLALVFICFKDFNCKVIEA